MTKSKDTGNVNQAPKSLGLTSQLLLSNYLHNSPMRPLVKDFKTIHANNYLSEVKTIFQIK